MSSLPAVHQRINEGLHGIHVVFVGKRMSRVRKYSNTRFKDIHCEYYAWLRLKLVYVLGVWVK